ncbi:hypothetical protein [Nocardioides sp. TF02-7]|uniref:hypothetical protein n=1 Tax=Nocardioides sp. TF02-7 TaxID=2917724 RepID=UPI001F061155|nr:hypothetical protein [Nocardioides sp. TF02-7]UMG91864.1 hypothetical protein MF408_17745 [Nocardioides sp. TF02-7]
MDAMRSEETNLADVLREALVEPDPPTVATLFAALGCFWVISGDHPRTIAAAGAVSRALDGWTPGAGAADRARIALAVALFSTMLTAGEQRGPVAEQLRALGPSDRPALRAVTTVLLTTAAAGLGGPGTDPDAVAALTDDPDPVVASIAWHWISHERENSGDPEGAIDAATRALPLIPADEGPWRLAVLHTQLSGLHAQFGDAELAGHHARIALPVLDRLGAVDDATQGKAVLAMAALLLGDRDEAAALVDQLADVAGQGTFGGSVSIYTSRGQLALADGDVAGGLRLHREAVEQLRQVRFPGAERVGGLEPWVIFGEAIALSAFAQLGEGDDGADLYADLRAKALATVDAERPLLDVPVVGLVLFGLGIWGALQGRAAAGGRRTAAGAGRAARLPPVRPDDALAARRRADRAPRPGLAGRDGGGVRRAARARPAGRCPRRPGRRPLSLATSCGTRSARRAGRTPRPRPRIRAAPSPRGP